MRSDKTRFALQAIRYNINLAQTFIGTMSPQHFVSDIKTFYAVTRTLEIVSEAVRRLPDEFRAKHPELPWRSIQHAGNFYRHQYDDIEEMIVFETVTTYLPPLLAVVDSELSSWTDGQTP